MAMNLSGDMKIQLTPDSESKVGETPTDLTAGENLSAKAWEEWKARGQGSARPPWWLLLLGVIALSVVYWLWGRGPGVAL